MWTIRPRACSQTTATAESEKNMDDNALRIRTAHLSDAPMHPFPELSPAELDAILNQA